MKKISAVVSAVVVAGLAVSGYVYATHATKHNSIFKNNMAKVSYALGYRIGTGFKAQKLGINVDMFSQGVAAGAVAGKSLLTNKEVETVLANFKKELVAKYVKKQKELIAHNLKASDEYMAKIAKEPGVKMIEKGLYYKVITEGHGPMPKATDQIKVNYEGTLSNGKVFDSSFKRGKPASFRVNQVIPGWTAALQKMPVGSTWMIYIAPKMAYGTFAPPVIGPNQALTFKVQLLSINKPEKLAPVKKPAAKVAVKTEVKAEAKPAVKVEPKVAAPVKKITK